MTCVHRWRELEPVSAQTSRVVCERCDYRAYAKARHVDIDCASTVASEWICCHLHNLLRGRGIAVNSPIVALSRPIGHELRLGGSAPTGPWYTWAAIIVDVGPHRQLSLAEDPPGALWPGWLYWFDRWVCRLDGWGGSNLLLQGNAVIPIDFGAAFGWALGTFAARTVHAFDMPHHPGIVRAADPRTRDAIKSLTNEEIWNATVGAGLAMEVCPTALLVAYWSGLCTRRDLLC